MESTPPRTHTSGKRRPLAQAAALACLWVLLLPVSRLQAQAMTRHPLPSHIPSRPGWTLTFDDEFDGTALDGSKWTATRAPANVQEHPLQYYRPEDVSVGQGILTIRTEQQSYQGFAYTSGEISSLNKFAQLYGRYEVRCRFPQTRGVWSAAYLLPASGVWPPEIDIAEFIGRDPQCLYLTNHWAGPFGREMHNNFCRDPAMDWAQWHTYVVEWKPREIRWYVDGILRGISNEGVASVPMYVRLNTAVGGYFAREPDPTGWPQEFQIDYVRVWQRHGGPAPVLGRTAPDMIAVDATTPPQAPASWEGADTLAVFLLFLLWMTARRLGLRQPTTVALLALTVGGTSCYYLTWRVSVINWAAWPVALTLLAAEVFGILQALGFQYTVWPRPAPTLHTHEDPTHRPLFVLIPTVNEGPAILESTIRGAQSARDCYLEAFPHGQVTIAVCNDGRVAGVPEWEQIEALTERLGVACITRTSGGGAKAGNIEQARQSLDATGDALLALFDADMVPEREFLLRTIPPFGDWHVGWVQTGQYYRNQDNPVARWAHDQQMVFFQTLCPGKAALNALFLCGTNVVVRAQALDEIGGLPQDSVTEDFAASVLLHGRWRSVYLPDVLATGLGPPDLPAYFAQQGRWATGTFDVLRRQGRRLITGEDGLTPAQRIQYLLSGTHYLCGLCAVIYALAPLLYLLGGVSALQGADVPSFLRHFLPFWLSSQLAFWYATGRRRHWRGLVLGFGSFPVLIASLFTAVIGRRVGFAVTAKQRRQAGSWRPLLPHLFGLLACLAGLTAALSTQGPLVFISALWVLYTLVMLCAMLWLGYQDQRGERPEAAEIAEPPRVPTAIEIIANAKRERQSGK